MAFRYRQRVSVMPAVTGRACVQARHAFRACKTVLVAFAQGDVDDLLARTGRMCVICNRLRGVQVHHIKPRHKGGSDDAANAIPLCPNCHDEVHAGYTEGRTTRAHTENELRGHLERTIALAARHAALAPGNDDWNHDVELVRFYAGCLDRPAFRTHFHNELSFAGFDQALEDTVLAISTGLWRTRDGTLIERTAGKRALVNAAWRGRMDDVVTSVMQARHELRQALGLDEMFMHLGEAGHPFDRHARQLRSDPRLGQAMDSLRQRAIDIMNEVLADAGLPALKRIGDWS
jgi:HNH endonuclease